MQKRFIELKWQYLLYLFTIISLSVNAVFFDITLMRNASSLVIISNDTYKYLIKARRHKIEDEIFFRNLQ